MPKRHRAALIAALLLLLPAGSAPPLTAADDDAEEAAARVTALRASLLRSIIGDGTDRWGVLVVSLDQGDTLFSFQPAAPLTPASNLKLFTTAAALFYLGPAYRFGTYVASAGRVQGGVLEGDLVLYGTGDPSVTSHFHDDDRDPWRALADTLAALGIREVRGDLVADASWFPSPSVPAGWRESYRSADYAAVASALSYHENTVSLRVLPGERPGWRPRVDRIPGGAGLDLTNVATTTAGGPARLVIERVAYDGPVVIHGRIPRGHRAVWREVPVADPARYAAAVFREALAERGIEVRGTLRTVREPARSSVGARRAHAPALREEPAPRVLAVHTSPPLQRILSVINHESNNVFAEQVLRTIGREVVADGSPEGGTRAVRGFLEEEVGIDASELRIHDGSGLSVLNRLTPASIVALLDYMDRSPRARSFHATLPVAGAPGGLRRMQRTPAQDNLRAKTGTIREVSALSGYVTASNGERLGFAIISNDVASTWRSKTIENRIGAELARFSRPLGRLALAEDAAGAADGAAAEAPRVAAADAAATGEAQEDLDADAAAPKPATPAHTIRPGDTLEGIGKRYGVSVGALRAANPGLDPRRLIPGREVRLPDG